MGHCAHSPTASDLGATLWELVENVSELRLAGRDARFERPPSMRVAITMVSVFVRYALGGRTHRVSLQAGHDAKSRRDSRQYGNEDLQNLSPNVRFVFHSE